MATHADCIVEGSHRAHRISPPDGIWKGEWCEPDDCGFEGYSCLSRNEEAGYLKHCAKHQTQRDAEQAERERLGRIEYCRMFGHDLSLQTQGEQVIVRCSNRCDMDDKYRLTRRES